MKSTPHKATQAEQNKDPRNWWIVDLQGKTLGRAATKIANTLRGKNKPLFTPHIDAGDFVIVINAEKVKLTGRKMDDKKYAFISQYPGGLRQVAAKDVLAKKPEHVIREAVRGMLPRTNMGHTLLAKLKVYEGPEHPHKAQNPKPLSV